MSYLRDLFFIFSLIFIFINHITLFKQTCLFLVHFLEYLLLFLDDNVDEESGWFSNNKSSTSRFFLAFAWFFANFSLALLTKVLLIKRVFDINPLTIFAKKGLLKISDKALNTALISILEILDLHLVSQKYIKNFECHRSGHPLNFQWFIFQSGGFCNDNSRGVFLFPISQTTT